MQQEPLQHVCPLGHVFGAPLVQQTAFATHWLPQALKPEIHVHVPLVQVAFAGHTVPHVPQLLPSLPVLRQVPLQQVCCDGHPGALLVQQRLLAMHWLPHALNPESQVQFVPAPLQVELAGQGPQEPPQPLGPHDLPAQSGTQLAVQTPALQDEPPGHVPQVLPQPSGPQFFPAQSGMHVQTPLMQLSPLGHMPQLPPQPLGPQFFPEQFGTQSATQLPLTHDEPLAHVPQLPPQPLSPQFFPSQSGTQVAWQAPSLVQMRPSPQLPQLVPQPSLPHSLPAQSGTQGGGGGPGGGEVGGDMGGDTGGVTGGETGGGGTGRFFFFFFFFFSECRRRRCEASRSDPSPRLSASPRRLRRFLCLRASASGVVGAERSAVSTVTTLASLPRRTKRPVVIDLISVSNRVASIASPACRAIQGAHSMALLNCEYHAKCSLREF